jgi:hypothetical protein
MRTVEKLLSSYPLEVRALADSARRLIRRLLPTVDEGVDSTAPLIGYSCGPGYRGMVCTLILTKSGVKLGLARGAELDDPHSMLEGSVKVHRYIQLHAARDLRAPGVSKLIKAAYSEARKRNEASRISS